MMRNILMQKLLPLLLTLFSTAALAHPGHLPNEAVHGVLHVEHIITLAVVGVIVYLAFKLRE